ncbi:MAG: hypothetical protein AB7U23_13255 [Dehalococcoidia bacterium]
MARGVLWPLTVGASGGLRMTDDTTLQTITLAVLPGQCSNPFSARDGIGSPDWTFAGSDAATQGAIRQRLGRIFDTLAARGRAELRGVSFSSATDSGRLTVSVRWMDLSSGQEERADLEVTGG